MKTGDIIAVLILGLFALGGIRGWFRWASGLLVGLLVGVLVLAGLFFISEIPCAKPLADFFQSGTITPYLGHRVEGFLERLYNKNDVNGEGGFFLPIPAKKQNQNISDMSVWCLPSPKKKVKP